VTWIELRKPLPIPYKPIHVAWSDGDTFEFQPRNAKRMCLPTDWAALKLGRWNQKRARARGNPWAGDSWDYRLRFALAFTDIVMGSNITFHRLNDYGSVWAIEYPKYPPAFNWSHDKINNKYSYEFYLDNDLEETSPTVIYDDDETFWSPHKGGTGGYDISISEELTEIKKGASSLRIDIGTGTYAHLGVYHDYTPVEDWSGQEFLCFYLYGVNSGLTIWVQILTPDIGNSARFNLVDNFTGWKRFVLPLKNPDAISGTYDLSNVNILRIQYRFVNQTFTSYLDRTVVDVGQWVQVEAYVPDVIAETTIGNPKFYLRSWDGASYVSCIYPHPSTGYFDAVNSNLYFLDGTTQQDIIPSTVQPYARGGIGTYLVGERGETKSRINESDSGAPPLTYSSYFGCKKRWGFAIKMPPDDGQDSSTYGISQCKLKLEVYYDKETYAGVDRYGAVTFEFEDSTNSYYGLQLITEAWIALFPVSGASKGAEMLFLSAKPTGLEISADEDQVIYRVKLTLPKGTAVYAGSLLHGDVTLDSDGDGVPDCLEMLSYQLTGQ